jgi:hypothetical protein
MSCLTSTGPTWCETVDRHAVNRWPSLREIRTQDGEIARPHGALLARADEVIE